MNKIKHTPVRAECTKNIFQKKVKFTFFLEADLYI